MVPRFRSPALDIVVRRVERSCVSKARSTDGDNDRVWSASLSLVGRMRPPRAVLLLARQPRDTTQEHRTTLLARAAVPYVRTTDAVIGVVSQVG